MIQEIPLNLNGSEFYQYAFSSKIIKKHFSSHNFLLKEYHTINGIKCLKNEISWIELLMQKLYDYRGNSLIIGTFRFLLDVACKPITSHLCFMVFQKGDV